MALNTVDREPGSFRSDRCATSRVTEVTILRGEEIATEPVQLEPTSGARRLLRRLLDLRQ